MLVLLLATSQLYGQSKITKTTFKVFGNCVMCKNRIEGALDKQGIKFVQWNVETKSLEVVYNNRKISEKEVHSLIASTGHDTNLVKAQDDVYAKLPFCCLYRDHDHSNIVDSPHDH